MQGPTQRWDEPPDPRESTVSMPRIDASLPARHVSEPATAAYDNGTGAELPGFGDPYALPVRPDEPAPEPAAGSGRSSAQPAAAAAPELAVTPERVVTPGPEVASAPEPAAPPQPETPELAAPLELVAPETPRQAEGISGSATRHPPRPAARRAVPGVVGKPQPGSIAELRGRLERLPDGHPSSPYDDAGWLKPSPTRLRQLELGLPARSLGTKAGYSERFGIDPDDDANDGLAAAAPTSPHAEATTPGDELLSASAAQEGVGARGAPPFPEKAPPPATRPAASNGHHDSGASDGGLRLQHPYADSAEPGRAGNGGSGELALTRLPAKDTVRDRGSAPHPEPNGHQPPAASRAAPGGQDRERAQPDPGPREIVEASLARQRLAPEIRDLVDRIMAACRTAEGRSARGGYGTSGITPALRRIAAQLPTGGLAPGSEADTLKSADRFAVRLARLIDRQPGRPPAELAATISDGIRYAFTFPAPGYTEGTLLVHRKLKAQGFDLEARRNQWDSREYKGVFTRWRDPAHGLAFEVQFHTIDSWAVIKGTHDAYLRITDAATPAAERARLRTRQVAAAATISTPPGCLDITDFPGRGPMSSGRVQYFVIVADQRSRAAAGLARRTYSEAGPVDESLRGDLSWQPDSAIVEWEYGDLAAELVPISESEAENLTQAFGARWRGTR